MHQVVQNVRDGRLKVEVVPEPLVQRGQVLIANVCSLISGGTEKMITELARKSLLGKARERPDHVRRVLEKMRNEGFFRTIQQVLAKLDDPFPMGYASAGIALGCGAGVPEFKPGDRVASNGPHAGVVCVPRHLCARIPESVPFESGAFAVPGAIALQSVRLAKVELGSTALVIGLGLIGQLAVGLLKAAGARVLGTDPDRAKCDLACRMGADWADEALTAQQVEELTGGLGVDAVVIAAATKSSAPMGLAVDAVRKKGRIVLVGVVGLQLERKPFYLKECEFVVSCSYGPGRYDPLYEEKGIDYPPAYVRWTEQRNMRAVLDLMAAGRLDVAPLISHRFPIERAEAAYELIEQGSEPYLGIVLQYPEAPVRLTSVQLRALPAPADGKLGVGMVGAGNFARAVLLPALKRSGRFHLRVLCSAKGLSASHAGDKHGFDAITTDQEAVFADPAVKCVFILMRHDQHASGTIKALRAGKSVFVEKPLALTVEELGEIEDVLRTATSLKTAAPPILMVGFNRRFSPAARTVKQFFADCQDALTISIRFNVGKVPADHWTQDEEIGGGRIIGEACHAIDLAVFLAGAPPARVYAEAVSGSHASVLTQDQAFITLAHTNGNISSIAYLAGGDKAFPKERIEVIGGGRVAVIDDFKSVTTCKSGKLKTNRFGAQDKGHFAEIAELARVLTLGGPAPIPWEDLRGVSMASILAVRSIREAMPFDL